MLDTILTSKSLYCQQHGITLTCVADGAALDFMDTMDLCSLFGNALDNAIESVEKLPDSEQRLIHLVVTRKKNFVWIRVENTYDGAFRADGTLPKTTKTDARYHGYGLKSIYDTAEKYGGTAEISTQEKRFTLKVLLPVQQNKPQPAGLAGCFCVFGDLHKDTGRSFVNYDTPQNRSRCKSTVYEWNTPSKRILCYTESIKGEIPPPKNKKEKNMKKQTKKTLWRGLTSTSAVLMVVSLFGTQCAITYTGTLNSYLGTTTSRIVSTGDPSAEDTNYYTSEFGDYSAENLQKLIQATYDESVLEQEEGSVLLRNNNSALPLSPNSHVTLFGHATVQPVYAPGGANSGAASTGTYVIDLYQALKDVGFSINDTLYDAYKNSSTSRVASNNLTISGGPNSTGDFNAAPVLGEEPKSFYTAQLQQSWENDYNDVAIVMLAREGGEDCEMMMEDPDGISALALHQDEKICWQ